MPACQFPLPPDLQEATELGLLTLAEAWQLLDDWILYPTLQYPREWKPLLDRLDLLAQDPGEMTRH